MKTVSNTSRILLAIASLSMVVAYFVPFWQIWLWAPQYPDWLYMKIWLYKLSGDVEIINGLNHYIGMKYIREEMFTEFKIMPWVLGGIITFGLLTAIAARKWMVWTFLVVLVLAAAAGLYDFYKWTYDYGHNLDPTAAIKVPGMTYQPPIIGTKELLNFIAYSAPDIGGYVLGAAGVLVMLVLYLEHRRSRKAAL